LAATVGCSSRGQEKADVSASAIALRGVGATLPSPLYAKWFQEYHREHPNVAVEYEALGSGEGTTRFLEGSVDFAASDAALTDEQIASVQRGAVLVPTTAGSIAFAYSPRRLPPGLKLSRALYVDIFLGKVARWNDERIAKLNPGVALPDLGIAVVVRQDRSGTTFAFTNHLAAVSEQWRNEFGVGTSVGWPGRAMRATGNQGVARLIKESAGAIGYVEYGEAKRAGLEMACLENRAGKYIQPTGTSGLATLIEAKMPSNLRLFIPDPEGDDSYPIVTFSWLLLYGKYSDPEKRDALKDLVRWCLNEGQQYNESLGYIRLAPHVVAAASRAVDSVQ
jgi:phosphate transport system substrate-binding protein